MSPHPASRRPNPRPKSRPNMRWNVREKARKPMRRLGLLAAAVIDAHAAGTWPRLKVCVEDTCQWAFIDSSKNRSRSWCSMRICGNRTKTRAYRARNRAAGAAGRS